MMVLAYVVNTVSVMKKIADAMGFGSDDASQERVIIGKLQEIQSYLRGLGQQAQELKDQNEAIMRKLDELPKVVQQIVTEVIAEALLEERYSTLLSIQTNYFELGEDERIRYRINTPGWDRLSEALTYLCMHENRVSRLFEVLAWCEFALVATENDALPVVRSLVNNKGSLVKPLLGELHDRLYQAHNGLVTLLSSQYVASHDFGERTTDLGSIHYRMSTPLPETFTVLTFDCPEGGIPNGGCKEVEVERKIPANIEYNRRLRSTEASIKNMIRELEDAVADYAAIRDAVAMLNSYGKIIDFDRRTRASSYRPKLHVEDRDIKAQGEFFVSIPR